jgi:acetyltransferase-like isoleucine patch superfamily enzyme
MISLKIKLLLNKIIYRILKKDKYLLKIYEIDRQIYKKRNVFLGKNTVIYNTVFTTSFKGDSFYIGDNCTITGATLLGHDASPALFIKALQENKYPILPASRRSFRSAIHIGNNVFIGVGSIILPGINIGDNIVVAAGSVVTKDIESNQVVGGNPAKKIKTIDEFKLNYQNILDTFPESF